MDKIIIVTEHTHILVSPHAVFKIKTKCQCGVAVVGGLLVCAGKSMWHKMDRRVFMGRCVVCVSQQVVILQRRKDNSVQYT